MFGFTVSDIARICNGRLSPSKPCRELIQRIVIDSRSARKGDLFAAYAGEHADGHDFVNDAFSNHATAALVEREIENAGGVQIVVEDVQKALEAITIAFRNEIEATMIGVVGSVGKTTTKEMTAAVLGQKYNVYKTSGNYNNLIGVPLTMSGITEQDDICVIEMGISVPGEMDRLGAMVQPDMVIFTAIGHAHLEYLGDLDGVYQEKTRVLSYMQPSGMILANGDDPYLQTLSGRENVLFYGTGKNCEVRAVNLDVSVDGHASFTVFYRNRKLFVRLPAYGRHLVYAVLAAVSAGFLYNLDDEEILAGIAGYEVVGRRGAVVNTGYLTLVDDCYNSNIDSCKMALQSLMDLPGRHVAILGDFLEQGAYAEEQHREIGQFARTLGVEQVIGVGEYGKFISSCSFETKQQLLDVLPLLIREGDTVLVKASLGAHLEEVSEALKKLPDPPSGQA